MVFIEDPDVEIVLDPEVPLFVEILLEIFPEDGDGDVFNEREVLTLFWGYEIFLTFEVVEFFPDDLFEFIFSENKVVPVLLDPCFEEREVDAVPVE